jgi:hypothetical protein
LQIISTLENKSSFNKQKCLFPKMKDRKVKQILAGSWYQWEGGGYKERVKEGEWWNIMYSLWKLNNETC